MSNAYKAKLEIKKPKNIAMVFNHTKRGIMPKKTERRRGIYSQNPKEKPKPKVVKRIDKKDVSEILKQGRMKNKEEMEQILQSHGGNFKTDFGLRETIDFEMKQSTNGWNKFYSIVKDNIQDKLNEKVSPNVNSIQSKNVLNGQGLNPMSPTRQPSRKPESLTEMTRLFAAKNANKSSSHKNNKSKPIKMINNFRQKKKKKFKRDDLNFKTPPPKVPYATIDPSLQTGLMESSFQGYCEEPEIQFNQKQSLNMLKASISKLSIDFAQDRQFLKGIKQRNRNQINQFGGSPFIKSAEGFTIDHNDSRLPSINQSTNIRNGTIKSPVMESIRQSRQNKSRVFASIQKFKQGGQSYYDNDDCDDTKSDISDISNMRASYVHSRYVHLKYQYYNTYIPNIS